MSEVDEGYQALCNEKSAKESQKNAVESDISSLNSKIDVLNSAYKKIDKAKESVKDINKDIRKMPNKYDDSWKGQFADKIYTDCKKDGERIDKNYNYYLVWIDSLQDDLNNKLTDLENEKLKKECLLGDLWAAINSLATSIQNYFN